MYRASDVWKGCAPQRTAGWLHAVRRGLCAVALLACLGAGTARGRGVVPGPPLNFQRDTFSFANETVYLYPKGYAEKRVLKPGEKPPGYVLHCFPMVRAAQQFRRFARFDPSLPVPDDAALARLVRRVTRHAVWRNPLPPERRVVIPGYADLRALSQARGLVLQKSIGQGWTSYVRPGNYRMFPYQLNGPRQQGHTQERVEDALRRNDLFCGYLTTYPSLSINHAIIIYGRRPATRADAAGGTIHYLVYDPNHPEAPRDIVFNARKREFSYQKDWDFVGGKVTLLQVYGYPGQ